MFFEKFVSKLKELKYVSNELNFDEISFKFEKYFEILVTENEKYNLTAITEKDEVYLKHFYDSCYLLNYKSLENLKVLDIGSGAGFPGIPLAILCKNTQFYLCEPTTKRAKFLEMVASELGLENVIVLNKRAEELDKKYREYFDVVTSRAVSALNILMEISVPFVKTGALFIPLKGSNANEELKAAKNAMQVLTVKPIHVYEYEIDENLCRTLIFFNKYKSTKLKYPRNYSLIKSKSL